MRTNDIRCRLLTAVKRKNVIKIAVGENNYKLGDSKEVHYF